MANGLNANMVRRWVVAEERAQQGKPIPATSVAVAAATVEQRTFIPLELERPRTAMAHSITIELSRGATMVKVDWPLSAVADCAGWLRTLLR